MCGFCNMWVCICVGFVACGCFDNCVVVLVICVLVFTVLCIVCTVFLYCLYSVFVLFVLCFCIVSFMYIYSYLFCLHWCKDYCHRVTTQLQ